MKLRRFESGSDTVIAAQFQSKWIPLSEISNVKNNHKDMIDVLDSWDQLKPEIEKELSEKGDTFPVLADDAVPMLPFEPRSFRDFMLSETHAIDAGRGMVKRFLPKAYKIISVYEKLTNRTFPVLKPKPIWYEQPIYYMGNHMNFVADQTEIKWPAYSLALDYEIELGFVITKNLLNCTREEATAAIGGFVIVNDFSARDVQIAEMRSGLGPQKAKHFINAMSADIVPAKDIYQRIDGLKGEVFINDQKVAETRTEFLHHDLADILVHVSKDEPLYPGELFAAGTLAGGCALENNFWVSKGDTLKLAIEEIGTLTNKIV